MTPRASAVRFIVCLGLVSLFADMTYEGARSVIGPFLQNLGASAAMGLLYDHSVMALVVFGVAAQSAAAAMFFRLRKPLAAARTANSSPA
jgi:hypothetical protein